jgi:hypothetical protein
VSKADELRLLREAIKSFPDALAVRDASGRVIATSDSYAKLAAPQGKEEFQGSDGRWLRRSVSALEGGGTIELVADVTELRRAEQAMLPRLSRHADRPAQPAAARRPAAPGDPPRAAPRSHGRHPAGPP